MKPVMKILQEKKLIGMRTLMSLKNNRTEELWRSFMPLRNEISNKLSDDLISMQVYSDSYFKNFNPDIEFEKWAALEVDSFNIIPPGMETFVLKHGLYAVFLYKGLSTDKSIFQYIFSSWLPNSSFVLDNRPHFEVLGSKYKNNDPHSEEEIWIPVKPIA